MNIAYAVDVKYLWHAAISMQSVENYHIAEHVTFWVLTSGRIKHYQWRDAFGDILKVLDVRRIDVDNQFARFGLSQHHEVTYVSEAMYLRLQLAHILPTDVERVLYLDADVLCTSPGLKCLFTLDLGENVLAAVRDPVTARLCDDNGVPFLVDHPELNPLAPYFNSGVLLIDTQRYRDVAVRDRCARYLEETAALRRYPDQDALNVVCHGVWLRLNKR